jgi:riboflavin kinase/FMN adenylyltransferase
VGAVVRGVVIAGDRRGRLLGYPTANIRPGEDEALPDDGVYAGVVLRADGSSHPAAVSIGCRPQFYAEDGVRLVEAYLLDFDGDLYGEAIEVAVGERVRGQLRFSSTDELVEQMGRDVEAVRALVSVPSEPGRGAEHR